MFRKGFDPNFARAMQECADELLKKVQGRCCYTQSDEITVLIPPQPVVHGVQQPHEYNGRLMKIATLSSSFVTSLFQRKIVALCGSFEDIPPPLFDCRAAVFDSYDEALAVLLWRAQAGTVNGVNDAIDQFASPGDKRELEKSSINDKLSWLHRAGRLPLPEHQVCGSFFARIVRAHEGFNAKSNTKSISLRWTTQQVPGNVLRLVSERALLPLER